MVRGSVVRRGRAGESARSITADYTVSSDVIRQIFRVHGVPLRKRAPRRTDVDVDDMVKRYERGESLRAVGQAHGVSASTARKRLLEAGVTIRSPGRKQAP